MELNELYFVIDGGEIMSPTALLNAFAQSDVDMKGFRINNLDTTNLGFGLPPSVHPSANQYLHDWDKNTQTWGTRQPNFTDFSGNLTASQQSAITQLGTIAAGVWQGGVIAGQYLTTLDLIPAPVANVSMNSKRLTSLADPVSAQDAVTLNFLDNLLQGLNPKQAVRVASTGNISSLSGHLTIDGVTLADGDRVLVKDQSVGPNAQYANGIYVADSGAWTRATDCDHGSEDSGETEANDINRAYCVITEGTDNAGTSWVQVNPIIHVNGTLIPAPPFPPKFVLFSQAGGGVLVPGNGLTLVGNTLSVVGTAGKISVGAGVTIDPTYAGQSSINKVGTITAGIWNGTIIDPAFGGSGVANDPSATLTLAGAFVMQQSGLATPSLTFVVESATSVTFPTGNSTMATLANAETLTNKRVQKRVVMIASSATPAINTDVTDVFKITTLNTAITSMSSSLTGTPVDGDKLIIWVKDNGTARAIAWGSSFTASSDLPLPLTTTLGKWLRMEFEYNATISLWVMITKLDNI